MLYTLPLAGWIHRSLTLSRSVSKGMLRLMTRSIWQMSFKALAWAMVLGNPAEGTGQRRQQTSWHNYCSAKKDLHRYLWTMSLRIKVLR